MNPYDSARRVKLRAKTPDPGAPYCTACFDGTPTERRAGKGLSRRLCRRHREFLARHGHMSKPSWRASEVEPFIHLAAKFIHHAIDTHANEDEPLRIAVRGTLDSYGGMVARATVSGQELPRRPGERAKALLGRLGEKTLEVSPGGGHGAALRPMTMDDIALKLAAVVVGLRLAHRFDPAPADEHYLTVQIGKAVHRLAGGFHREWTFEAGPPGARLIMERHKYAHSRGRALAILGERLIERDFITGARAHEALVADAKAHIPAGTIANWTDSREMALRTTKGGRRRKPYKRLEERGHDRVRISD